MPGKTYKTRGIVLRKTKLGEKDLIVTLLDESGSILRAVAKGARKPGGSYAARLELFSIVDLMCAQGRSLDVITSATFSEGAPRGPFDVEQAACASAVAEVLASLAQEGLPHERLYAMARAAFGWIATSSPNDALAIACSAMLKAFAFSGFRPSFAACVVCGADAMADADADAAKVPFSFLDGGVVCGACQRPADAVPVDANTLKWAEALMRAHFADVPGFRASVDVLFSVLHLIGPWARTYLGKNLKSLDFLVACGLFA